MLRTWRCRWRLVLQEAWSYGPGFTPLRRERASKTSARRSPSVPCRSAGSATRLAVPAVGVREGWRVACARAAPGDQLPARRRSDNRGRRPVVVVLCLVKFRSVDVVLCVCVCLHVDLCGCLHVWMSVRTVRFVRVTGVRVRMSTRRDKGRPTQAKADKGAKKHTDTTHREVSPCGGVGDGRASTRSPDRSTPGSPTTGLPQGTARRQVGGNASRR